MRVSSISLSSRLTTSREHLQIESISGTILVQLKNASDVIAIVDTFIFEDPACTRLPALHDITGRTTTFRLVTTLGIYLQVLDIFYQSADSSARCRVQLGSRNSQCGFTKHDPSAELHKRLPPTDPSLPSYAGLF